MGKRVFEEPWTIVAMDCMEFPKSKAQNKYLIVIIDLFTRWVEIRPGTPEVLITDNGTEFINKDVAKTLEEFGIHHTTIPPYCARTNPSERANRTIKTTIKSYVGADHRNWDVHVHELRFAINTAVQSSTRVSPAFLNFGRHPRRANTFRSEVKRRKINDWRVDESVWLDRVKRVNAIYDIVTDNVEKAHARQARYYNEGRKDVRFEVGDLVLRKAHYLSSGSANFTRKLAQEYDGSFKVAEVLSPTVYVLEMPNSRKNPKVDVGDLKPYIVGDADTARNATMSEQVLIDVFLPSTEMENTNETALQAVEEVIRLEEQQQRGAVSRQLDAAVAVTREQQQRALDKARQQAPPDVGASEQSVAAATNMSLQERPTAWWDEMEVDHEVEVATSRLPEATDRPRPRRLPMTPSPPPLSMKPSAVKSWARRARRKNPNRQWTVNDLQSAVGDISLPREGEGAALNIGNFATQPTTANPEGPEQRTAAPPSSVEQNDVPASSLQLPPALPSSVEQSGAAASESQRSPRQLSSGEQRNVPAASWDWPMDQTSDKQQDNRPASSWDVPSTSVDFGRPSGSASSRKQHHGQAARRDTGVAEHQHQGVASGRVGKTQKRRDRRHRLEERIAGGYKPPGQAPKKKERCEIHRGVFLGELARVTINDSIDPPDGTCFRCWQPSHRSVDCRSGLDEHFCGNCGCSGRHTAKCERCGARLRLMLPRLNLPHVVTRGLSGRGSEEYRDQRENEPPRAAGYRMEAWAVAVVEERPSPPAQAQGPPA
ncbi:hypothetical protein TKK_0015522 [Trichogramma kaykai]